jgi:hypothetical protein
MFQLNLHAMTHRLESATNATYLSLKGAANVTRIACALTRALSAIFLSHKGAASVTRSANASLGGDATYAYVYARARN